MIEFHRIREILNEIESLESDISYGEQAWADDNDPCAMAECDQFVKGEEIKSLIIELKEITNNL